jgi:hypothetical protein
MRGKGTRYPRNNEEPEDIKMNAKRSARRQINKPT